MESIAGESPGYAFSFSGIISFFRFYDWVKPCFLLFYSSFGK